MVQKEYHNDTSDNRSIFKAISVLGSMKFLQLLSGLIGAKFIALFIGPNGVGSLGLIKSAISLIQSFTSFGYSIISVKEIASKLEVENDIQHIQSIGLVKKLSIYIGLLGFLLTLPLSFFLSDWVFGSKNKFYWFLLLSFNFIFLARNAFYAAYLQGNRKIRWIAISGTLSSFITVILTIPIYYFLRENGIIPAIIVSSIVILCVNIYITKNSNIPSFQGDFEMFYEKAKPMLKMGVVLSLNMIFNHVCHFFLRSFFKNYTEGSILGFYEAGLTIIATYAGTIFSVMAVDFYPKLTSFHEDNLKVSDMVNKQVKMSLLIVTPMVLGFYLFDNTIISLLYTKEFLPVMAIFKFGLLCTIFKAISWPMSYIILAKGDRKQYLKQEILADSLNVLFIIILFKIIGLIGIGLGMTLEFIFFTGFVFFYVHRAYQFTFFKNSKKVIILSLILSLFAVTVSIYFKGTIGRVFLTILFLISITYSIRELNKSMDVVAFIKNKLFKH